MAADTIGVLDHVGIERAHIFGISMGGMIAQRIAIDHPHRVDRLVLGCTSPGGRPSPWISGRAKLAMLRARIGDPAEAVQAEAQMVLSDAFREAHPEVIAEWVKLAIDFPVKRSTLLLQLWAATRHHPGRQLQRVTAPTLIICSDADALVPPENSRLLARRIKGAEIEWIRGAGHDFATECPERTAAIVAGFLVST
jgi:pimeloyl-ACP methyl ester carboxylesterase